MVGLADGCRLDDVTATLEAEGVQKFTDSFGQIVASIQTKRGLQTV